MNAGEQIGPYVIEAPIGEGGMGAVYRARDTRLDRTVALKVSKADFSDRFEREAKAVESSAGQPLEVILNWPALLKKSAE